MCDAQKKVEPSFAMAHVTVEQNVIFFALQSTNNITTMSETAYTNYPLRSKSSACEMTVCLASTAHLFDQYEH
jgi:hypothetical protein